jgi:hypothetical protein
MNPDFKSLLRELNAHGVEYLVVGAHALAAHGCVRATKDLDIWIRAEEANAVRALNALAAFGAPLQDLNSSDLSHPGLVFQIGVPPLRIDVASKDGVQFDNSWRDRIELELGGEPTFVISLADLLANKKASGRLQDLADVEQLERIISCREQH